MSRYAVLLRGVNVGGKNRLSMSELRKWLEELEFSAVSTYVVSGNLVLESAKSADVVRTLIEDCLPKEFDLDSDRIRVLVLTRNQLQAVFDNRPEGFGEQPEKYHSDAIFLLGIDAEQAMSVSDPREGVDKVWAGNGVIYSQRLSSQRTKSRLSRIIGTPEYKSMTIRSWTTTTRLMEMLNGRRQ